MKYDVILDADKYVEIIRHTGTIRDYVELNLNDYDLSDGRIHAYKLGKNCLIWDQNRWDQILADRQAAADQAEIKDLKQKLNDSDYIIDRTFEDVMALNNPLTFITDIIKIMTDYRKKYAEMLLQRKAWRKRIEELGG